MTFKRLLSHKLKTGLKMAWGDDTVFENRPSGRAKQYMSVRVNRAAANKVAGQAACCFLIRNCSSQKSTRPAASRPPTSFQESGDECEATHRQRTSAMTGIV